MKKTMNFSSEKGITLSALIITIIIMMILAGVTISASYKQTNVINAANETMQIFNKKSSETTSEVNDVIDHVDSNRRGVTSSEEVGFEQAK